MAQHAPASNIAASTSVSSTVLGAYLHIAWKILLIMSIFSICLIIFGYIKLMNGKRNIAKQDMLIHKIKVVPKQKHHHLKNIRLVLSSYKNALNLKFKNTLHVINLTKFL